MILFCALQNALVVADMSIGSSVWREGEDGEGRGKKRSFAGRRGVEVIIFFWERRYFFMHKGRRN